ncbi:MAG TPA: DUF2946 family protein [Bradyrhizobium sp.]|jgi:uncharacterized iron-regulated membrane protein|nr:DUF2946 family protein [Bradyrhizobium sp.]
MKWFRSNIRQGARLALLALAIQFVLAFGHFHGIAAEAAPAMPSGASHATAPAAPEALSQSPRQAGSERNPDRQRSDDACAVCAVIAMANAVLFATPPVLRLPQAVEFLYRTTDAEFVHLKSARVAFQPRAPPAS